MNRAHGPMERAAAHDPAADTRAVVRFGPARFTVLAPALVRLEWDPRKRFEDRASQFAINRRLAVPAFGVRPEGGALTIETGSLEIRFENDGRPFHAGNLAIRRKDWPGDRFWRPGDEARGNLGGTARTLDKVSGATALEPGIISRDGWAVVDDSRSLVFEANYESGWLTPRSAPEEGPAPIDWYYFGHGRDYRAALRDFTSIGGRIPLPPRFVFGVWWSRYWAYTDEELKAIVREFGKNYVPLDVLVVDMDWHLEGWTGYTWDRRKFTDPEGFLKWCHEQGLRVTLNLHPAEGVTRHEERFAEFCRAVGFDPEVVWHVPFDCADPVFMRAYFEVLHRPLEEQGVDFWWLDWQQGDASAVEGLDPLWQLNHLHWHDMEKRATRTGGTPVPPGHTGKMPVPPEHTGKMPVPPEHTGKMPVPPGGKRPLIFSRWGGMGNHRYPIGFSGDTISDWDSLAFQPRFTATAANVGYGYWSHDIGGHYHGPVDAELYLRWIQYGVFSPILRTHTTKHPLAERRIWEFPTVFEAAREAMWLRSRLVPYIYTAARQAHDTGVSLCRPMYYDWPEHDEAYRRPDQYMFGDDLLVAPVTTPVDTDTGLATIDIWLPPGTWCDFFAGDKLEGDRVIRREAALDEVPVYARAGAIIPLAQPTMRTRDLPRHLQGVRLLRGERGEASYYEDDGETVGYERGEHAITVYRQRRADPSRHMIEIEPARGTYPGMLDQRARFLELMGFGPIAAVRADGAAVARMEDDELEEFWLRDDESDWTVILLRPRPAYAPLCVEIDLAPAAPD